MNTNERYHKITELLKNFKNGEDLYRKSALFNRAIQMMIEGANHYEILEQIIIENERLQHAFEDYINRDTRPYGIMEEYAQQFQKPLPSEEEIRNEANTQYLLHNNPNSIKRMNYNQKAKQARASFIVGANWVINNYLNK